MLLYALVVKGGYVNYIKKRFIQHSRNRPRSYIFVKYKGERGVSVQEPSVI